MEGSEDFTVRNLLNPGPYAVSQANSVAGFLAEVGRERGHSTAALPVMDGSKLVGVISVGLASQVPTARRSAVRVDEVMLTKDNSVVLEAETSIPDAHERLREGTGRGVVVEDGRVLGVVTREMVSQVLQTGRERARRQVADRERS